MQLVERSDLVEERYDDRQVEVECVAGLTRHGEVSWSMTRAKATDRGERAGWLRPRRRISRGVTTAAGPRPPVIERDAWAWREARRPRSQGEPSVRSRLAATGGAALRPTRDSGRRCGCVR